MPVFLLTDVLQGGRANIARKTAITSLHPQVCDFIVHNPKHYIDVVTLGISVVCLFFVFLCFNLSWYCHWSDSSSCASAHCFCLRLQEESQTDGQATEQLAQYAIHALSAFCVQLSQV